jgi:hypothetical protein
MPFGNFKTENRAQAYLAHALLHRMFGDRQTNWTKDQIANEHTRIVSLISEKNWRHTIHTTNDTLDETLPEKFRS